MKTFLIFFILCAGVPAQIEILNEALKKTNEINKVFLNITALSDDEENQIGESLRKRILKEKKEIKEYKFRVKDIFSKIKKGVKRTKIKYNYTVISEKEVNAYAIAGGSVFLNSGLIDLLESEEEIAFVIGHEIAHNELKHCAERIQYSVRASQINPVLGDVVGIAYDIYAQPFSKDQEYAADEAGVKLMQKAGYDKKGAVSFFRKLAELEKKYGVDKRDALNDFISSHPTAEMRRKKIEEMK